jgi:hypothetical protein
VANCALKSLALFSLYILPPGAGIFKALPIGTKEALPTLPFIGNFSVTDVSRHSKQHLFLCTSSIILKSENK